MGAIEAIESKQGAGSRQRYFQGESDKVRVAQGENCLEIKFDIEISRY